MGRKTTGTGRMRHLKVVQRRFKNGFREGELCRRACCIARRDLTFTPQPLALRRSPPARCNRAVNISGQSSCLSGAALPAVASAVCGYHLVTRKPHKTPILSNPTGTEATPKAVAASS